MASYKTASLCAFYDCMCVTSFELKCKVKEKEGKGQIKTDTESGTVAIGETLVMQTALVSVVGIYRSFWDT